MKLNKKATIFGILLVFGTLIILGTTIFSFHSAKDKLIIDFDSPKYLYQLNSIKENFIGFEEQSEKYAVHSAFYKILNQINLVFPNDCLAYSSSVILTDSCLPNHNEMERKFIENFNSDFQKLIESYPTNYLEQKTKKGLILSEYKLSPKFEVLIEDDILKINYEQQELILERNTDFINYSYHVDLPKQQTINLESYNIYFEDISKDVSTIYSKSKSCKNKEDINLIRACLNEISLKNFDVDAKKEGEYLILILKTKNKFFYVKENKPFFDKISLNFAIKD